MSHTIISREQARKLGLKRYFTGKPCPRGHLSERYVSVCACAECLIEKAWRGERSRLHRIAYRAKNIAAVRAWGRAAYWRHIEDRRERGRAWHAKNRTASRALSRAYHAADTDRGRRRRKAWCKANPEKVVAILARRRARLLGATGSYTATDVIAIFADQHYRCAYCRVNLKGRRRHVDHIVALMRGGSNERRNLQILCPTCNTRKHAKDPVDFARELGLLI